MKKLHPAEQYARDVLDGKILACLYVKQACQRYFDDLETGIDRGLYFDRKAAQKAISFFKYLRHYKGKFAGQVFELEPWQQFVLWNVFGWKTAEGLRRFRYGYIAVPRKNGKTTLMAGIGLNMLVADGENAAEVYTAATKLPQAKLCFKDAKEMVKKSPALKKRISVYEHNMHILSTASKFEPLAADSDKEDGSGPSCAIIDEYHAHKTDGMLKVLKSGMGAREQPLLWIITTAGFNSNGPCAIYEKNVKDVLAGRKEQDNLFGIIFTIDKKDDWEDPKVWEKANPSYHAIDTLRKFLQEEYNDAKNQPSLVVNFKTKNLNIWCGAQEEWISDKRWMACKVDVDWNEFAGCSCFSGLDLSQTKDITSLHLLFPLDDGRLLLKGFYWIPELSAKERVQKDDVNYDIWIQQGWIEETPGDVVDYDLIRRRISGYYVEDKEVKHDDSCYCDQFDIETIGFDRWGARSIVNNLTGDGVDMADFGQGFRDMSPPTKEFEKKVLKKEIVHDGNPVTRWMLGNVAIQRDPAGNIKVNKAKSKEKVDGIVTAIMALGEYITAQGEEDNYDYEVRSV